jgi:hypothetical protein
MATNPFYSDTWARAALDAACALANSGKLRVYTGSQPADSNAAIGAVTLLAEFTLAATAFGASSVAGSAPNRSATATAAAISNVNALAGGTAAWFRVWKSDGTTALFDGTVGVSGCDLNMVDTSLSVNETCSVSSLTVSCPE